MNSWTTGSMVMLTSSRKKRDCRLFVSAVIKNLCHCLRCGLCNACFAGNGVTLSECLQGILREMIIPRSAESAGSVEKDENLTARITTLFMREQSGEKRCFHMPNTKATAHIRLSYTDTIIPVRATAFQSAQAH